ncbi:MAG: GatB/YqeY domain-containing protein [Bacteroidales bacterium]|jgi:hypothetical protein|nr:GatB/YqeY domain-containing protein [Bacteroidales bacterium]
MELENKINADIKQAMIGKESQKLEALRAVKAALLLAKTSKEAGGGELPEEAGLKLLQKLIKQRHESADIYQANGRQDLAEQEIFQASVIETYLPKQMSEDEIRTGLQKIITETGASSAKDMGRVMGLASKEFAGKADNKVIADMVRKMLGL